MMFLVCLSIDCGGDLILKNSILFFDTRWTGHSPPSLPSWLPADTLSIACRTLTTFSLTHRAPSTSSKKIVDLASSSTGRRSLCFNFFVCIVFDPQLVTNCTTPQINHSGTFDASKSISISIPISNSRPFRKHVQLS